ncbi:MAG: hypothetical protein NXI12_06580 [Alphaproteobacteria bacterium]|nr:hypothetical protein [Alphaproteobacteria bacterium]
MTLIRTLAAAAIVCTAGCAQAEPAPSAAAGPLSARPVIQMSLADAACLFAQDRFAGFIRETPPGEVRNAISAQWLTLQESRSGLAALLAQQDRDQGPDAPFAMGYRPDFARAIDALRDAHIDRFHAGLTRPGPIACRRIDTAADPFTEDLRGFLDWAEAQMMNPDPGAPDGAQTLAISRPVYFDGDTRVLVAESYTYTPIPLSRPPSATLAFVVYVREDGDWMHEASMILARGG